MRVKVVFKESNETFKVKFREAIEISDGGYEKGYAEGYEKGNTDGKEIGKAEGYEQGAADGYNEGYAEAKAEEEIFFTDHGTMYKRHMVIDYAGNDGFYAYAYRYANKMETLSIPNMKALYSATGYIFNGCTALKTASLPNIQRIGARYFWDCTSLESITLGTKENPMQQIAANSFTNCPALKHFNYIGIIDVNADFSGSPELTHDSLITILNCAVDKKASGSTGTLIIGPENIAKLSDDEKLIATNKGWELK